MLAKSREQIHIALVEGIRIAHVVENEVTGRVTLDLNPEDQEACTPTR